MSNKIQCFLFANNTSSLWEHHEDLGLRSNTENILSNYGKGSIKNAGSKIDPSVVQWRHRQLR